MKRREKTAKIRTKRAELSLYKLLKPVHLRLAAKVVEVKRAEKMKKIC